MLIRGKRWSARTMSVLALLCGLAPLSYAQDAVAAGLPVQPPAKPASTDLSLAPFWLSMEPVLAFPFGDSTKAFTMGGGGVLSGAWRLPFFPLATVRAGLEYGYHPILARQSVSFASVEAGLGIGYNLIPNLGVVAHADGGATYGFFNSSFEGYWNPYVRAGAGLALTLPPRMQVTAEGLYLWQAGLYQGLGASLGLSVGLGTPRTVQTFAAPAASGKPRPQPLGRQGTGLEVSSVKISDVYPVFYKHYDDHPLGSAVLRNWERSAVTNVRVSFFVKEYMTDPKETKGPDSIPAGQEATVDLYGLFKKDVLANTEDTKVSALVTLRWVAGGKESSKESVQTVRVLRRNALTWDDDRKAAAFVSPNDPGAVRFAKNVAAAVKGKGNTSVEPTVRMAAAIHDALSLYGLAYTADPVATLNSDNRTVDYIQFPSQTLEYRSGKCSDFSALYASMFEAVGIETAFITIPGHIYMAAALSLSPDDARAAFTHKDDLIYVDNRVWLPIEITLRDGGFMKAWQEGAKEWRENLARKQAVLYPLREAWKTYEPVGYSAAEAQLKIPADEKIAAAMAADIDAFVKGEMGQQESALKAAVAKASTTATRSKALNSLAVLHSRFGLYDQALSEFGQVLAKDEYVPSLVNAGNVWFLRGSYDKALELYQRAAKKSPRSPTVLLCVARANHALENYSVARKAYTDLSAVDPELAQRFSYLDLRGDEATRAADAGGVKGTVVWSE
jgi:tetratricopeptide (TPR) repeat protein